MDKRKHLQEIVLGKLDVHMQKNEIRPVAITLNKLNSKWTNTPSVKPEPLKVIGENIDRTLHDIGVGKDFVRSTHLPKN